MNEKPKLTQSVIDTISEIFSDEDERSRYVQLLQDSEVDPGPFLDALRKVAPALPEKNRLFSISCYFCDQLRAGRQIQFPLPAAELKNYRNLGKRQMAELFELNLVDEPL